MEDISKSLLWWDGLSIRQKWDLFYKYNPEIADARATIGLNLSDIYPSHIAEIWVMESKTSNK